MLCRVHPFNIPQVRFLSTQRSAALLVSTSSSASFRCRSHSSQRPHVATRARLPMSVRTLHCSPSRYVQMEPKKDDKVPQNLAERAAHMWSTIKYLFRFYMNGVKQIWLNRRIVLQIKEDVRCSKRDYTWEEARMVRIHTSDMLKLPLFLLILVTVEELLPLMVIYTPFMLPSTCILPSQRNKIRQRFEVKREKAIQALNKTVPSISVLQTNDNTAKAAVAALSPAALKELVTVYNLSQWGGSALRRRRVLSHMRLLVQDDQRLETSETLSSAEDADEKLSYACVQRGIRAVNVSSQDMRLSLRLWLEHTSKEADLSHLERLLLPTRIPRLGAPGTSLDTEVNQHDKRSVSEKTSTVVEEVVEQEKRRESNQSSS